MNYNGPVSISYTITDADGDTSTAAVAFNVTSVDDAPVAGADSPSNVTEDSGLSNIAVLGNDSFGGDGPSTGSITVTPISALVGTAVVNNNGTPNDPTDDTIDFTPALNYNGPVSISYTITDADGDTATATVTFNVTSVDDAPLAQNNAYSGLEDAVSITGNVITDTDAAAGLDSDLDSAALTVQYYTIAGIAGTQAVGSAVTIPSVGDITILADGSLTFVPVSNYTGTVPTVTYTLTDGALTDTADIVVSVTAVNDAPVAQNNAYSGLEDAVSITGNVITDTDATAGLDSDLDSAVLTVQYYTIAGIAGTQAVGSAVTIPSVGDITILADGSLTFVPVSNYTGTVPTVTYTLTDGALTDTADIVVSVTAVNDAPVAQNNAYSGLEDAVSITGNVITDTDATAGLDSDLDSAVLTVQSYTIAGIAGTQTVGSAVTIPSVGDITILTDGSLTFVPVSNYNGTVPTVTYTLTDGALTDTADVVISVTASSGFSIQANKDDAGIVDGSKASTGIFNVLTNDTFNGLPVNASDMILTADPNANFIFNSDGTIDTLANIPGGTYILNYNICEKANPSNCSSSTVTVFVSRPNIALVKTAHFNDENGDGYAQAGETITYSFEVANTGNVPLTNVTITDPLPGVLMSGIPLSLAVGESNTTHFKGEYSIKQVDINSGSVSNQAIVYGTSPDGIRIEDKSDDLNLGDDNPTVLLVSGCAIEVFNALTIDGSGQYDKFYIRGLECYPDNSIKIFNRWGVLVFEREHYDNINNAFKGISEGRVTVEKSQELPVGTYFYILKYTDSNSNTLEKSGYLYLNRK